MQNIIIGYNKYIKVLPALQKYVVIEINTMTINSKNKSQYLPCSHLWMSETAGDSCRISTSLYWDGRIDISSLSANS